MLFRQKNVILKVVIIIQLLPNSESENIFWITNHSDNSMDVKVNDDGKIPILKHR